MIIYHLFFIFGSFISGIICVLIFEKCSIKYLHNISFWSCNRDFLGPAINSCLICASYYFLYMHFQEKKDTNFFDYAHYFLVIFSRTILVSFKYGFYSDLHNELVRTKKLSYQINRSGLIIDYLNDTKPETQLSRIETAM